MPFVVPPFPVSSGYREGTTSLLGSLTPVSVSGFLPRLGARIGAYPPFGIITCTTGWGWVAGVAPAGTNSLVVSASGFTFERGGACAVGGYASAQADLFITVEEFVPLAPVDLQVDLSTFGPGAGPGDATIASPGNPLAGRQFLRAFTSGPTRIIRMWTAALGLQVLDQSSTANITFVMPIAPGNTYRCWLYAVQSAVCMSPGPAGWAYSYFFLDFPPVFFSFTT
jgi:hypothetical protein